MSRLLRPKKLGYREKWGNTGIIAQADKGRLQKQKEKERKNERLGLRGVKLRGIRT